MKINSHTITRNKVLRGLYQNLVIFLLNPIMDTQKFRTMMNERPLEYAFLLKHLSQICPKTVLDVGTGRSALPHLLSNCGFDVTAVDKMGRYWEFNFFNHHYPVEEDDIKNSKLDKKFDFISCVSVLENIPDPDKAIRGMFNLLKPGGHLLLTIPFNGEHYIENVYELEGAGYGQDHTYICQSFTQKELNNWLDKCGGKLIDQEYYEIFTGKYWTFGERIYPPKRVFEDDVYQLSAILIQKI